MNVTQLVPKVEDHQPFSRDRLRYIPALPGCYALTTVQGHVLYIGLATSLANRCAQHLDNSVKTEPTNEGRAVHFYWRQESLIEALERGWLNAHRVVEGRLPLLNINDSPVAY